MSTNIVAEELITTLLSNALYCPCLVIGGYVPIFKKLYEDQIFTVYNIDSVRDLVNRFSGISDLDGKFLVIDGIGFLNESAQTSLLKFIEDSKSPIILLSYYDKISPIIKSRAKFIFKRPLISCKNLKFQSTQVALKLLEDKRAGDKEFTYVDEVRFLANTSPTTLVYKHLNPNKDLNQNRILNLISKL